MQTHASTRISLSPVLPQGAKWAFTENRKPVAHRVPRPGGLYYTQKKKDGLVQDTPLFRSAVSREAPASNNTVGMVCFLPSANSVYPPIPSICQFRSATRSVHADFEPFGSNFVQPATPGSLFKLKC